MVYTKWTDPTKLEEIKSSLENKIVVRISVLYFLF